MVSCVVAVVVAAAVLGDKGTKAWTPTFIVRNVAIQLTAVNKAGIFIFLINKRCPEIREGEREVWRKVFGSLWKTKVFSPNKRWWVMFVEATSN
jgi:hypothetical protein